MAARSFLGAGDVYLERIIDGVSQGLVGKIYADKFEIKPGVDTKQSTSKGKEDYGQVLETVNLAKPVEFTLDLKEVTGDILVMAFLGTSSSTTQASGTLTAAPVTATTLDRWIELGKKGFTGALTVTNSGASTTYDEGDDYEVNRDMGWIKPLSTGAITEAEALKVTGTYGAVNNTVIAGSTNTDIRARIIFDGINQADGSRAQVEVFEAVIATDSAFDFLANDFGNVSLTGTLKTPSNKTAPFEVTVPA